jgi:hypothetical protein
MVAMPRQEVPKLKKWDFLYPYRRKLIPYSAWSSGTSGRIETVIFLGTVQIEQLAVWVAESCPPHTLVVQGAPHWYAKPDGSDIPEFMFGFTKSAFDTLLKHFSIRLVRVVVESQAVPGIVGLFLLDEYTRYLGKLVLVSQS